MTDTNLQHPDQGTSQAQSEVHQASQAQTEVHQASQAEVHQASQSHVHQANQARFTMQAKLRSNKGKEPDQTS